MPVSRLQPRIGPVPNRVILPARTVFVQVFAAVSLQTLQGTWLTGGRMTHPSGGPTTLC